MSTIKLSDFLSSSFVGNIGPTGPIGPTGDTGPQGEVANINVITATVPKTAWTQDQPSIATISVPGVKETDRPIVDIDLSGVSFQSVDQIEGEWALVYRVEASADDEIKLYARISLDVDVDLIVKVVS